MQLNPIWIFRLVVCIYGEHKEIQLLWEPYKTVIREGQPLARPNGPF